MPKNIKDNVLESRASNSLFTFHILAPLLLSTANKLVVSVVDLVEQAVMTLLLSDPEALPSLQPVFCLEPPYTDPCKLPAVRGPCKASLHRYFYNSTSIECEPFTYGGCQGNANNFETTEICVRVCKPPGESSDGNRSNGGDSMLGM
uniref:BPTI/Kunitz inhibitor domain-containing protein n=1 Tax=Phocoena sinus TaxID=42100 RepID=A0A8C9CGY6_PHOSS